ncbi:conjugative relaxase-like TrwC/TraI family protein [Ereboglobus sp. PH5-10]|uniref:Conjugal transfer protein n=2 Tax=Ereboglobus luteus TaxID=1796921 RepID=A0A2U8E414_9BACT|nr:MobF family relaxase [Ereboglobus sp. PH5-10]AWI09657.1 conjugal transfer protein [Ereboglobus luteus]MDF9828066.1 conjugative relaxase-like TrwC/TraI family protein [Ereboglobus sp. PH5-10]
MGGIVMLSPKPQLNLANALGYFREHLAVGDYYMDGHVVAGQWRGIAASMLDLEGVVTEEKFLSMCQGIHPDTGQRLTMRHNTTRRDGEHTVSNRRVFYDFTISPPKSVSVVALYQDARIIALHDHATRVMMDELEKFAETRVRKGGANSERVTGGVAAAMFRHDTSRELDPHLHTHCVVFNATYDFAEEKWKALHATGMYRAQKFAENLYYHELAKGLRQLGYDITNTPTGFEIQGVPQSVIDRFSKRHQQIDAETKKRIETEGLRGNEKALREQVAHDKRRRKIKNMPAEQLRPHWAAEMPEPERAALAKIGPPKLPPPLPETSVGKCGLPQLVEWADAHLFERRSVVGDYELMSSVLERGRGENFALADLEKNVAERGYIRDAQSRKLTSRDALSCELSIVLAAQNGVRNHAAFNAAHQPAPSLSAEQRAAVSRILRSRDFITVFQGGAGTGKSFALREVVRGLEAARHPVVVIAPQHQQAADLRRDGLASADTLARLLAVGANARLPRGAVVIVDEAGQVGGRDMRALIERVQACGGRLILSGDIRQQGAVAASDALRAIEEHTSLQTVRLGAIRRQDPQTVQSREEKAFVRKYRAAVKAAAEGRLVDSFDKLDALGCVRELDVEDRMAELAREYCDALARKEKVLAVAQTWDEVRAANDAIRSRLRETGKLGEGVPVMSWQSTDLSEAQKCDARYYTPDARVFFVRDYGRFKRGDCYEVAGADERGVALGKDGRTTTISYRYADRFVVVKTRQQELARGDRLLMKFNGDSIEGKAVRNGELVTICRVLKDKSIRVRDDEGTIKTLSAEQRMFVPGYAVTSYASQGKTVDTVLVSHDAEQTPINRHQWYVGISRARRKVVVFTGDKEALRLNIERESDRELALSIKPDDATVERMRERLMEEHQHRLSLQARQRLHESVRQWVPPPQQQQNHTTNRGIRP